MALKINVFSCSGNKLLLLILFTSLQMYSLAQQKQIPDTTILRIDPSNAMGGNCDKIYSDINYIPLENSKQCLISEINKLEVVGGYFIVLDASSDQILVFNKDGSFHAKCGNIKGLHKNPSIRRNMFRDFCINRYRDQIVVRSGLDPENLYLFDYNGEEVGKTALANIDNVKGLNGINYLDKSTCVYAISSIYANPDTSKYKPFELFIVDSISSNTIAEVPYNPNEIANAKWMDVQIVLAGPLYYSGINGTCFFTRSYDYNIYKINNRGVSDIYKVLLPIDISLPVDFLVNEEKYRGKRIDYLTNNRQKVFVISNVFVLGDNLLFTLNTTRYGDENKILSYNLGTGALYSLLRISPDVTSFFLPVLGDRASIQACDGQSIYSSVSSLHMFNSFEDNKDKHPNYPPVLKKYFSTQTREGNPVIIQLKPKAMFK
ncbi:6-bladed beta-propeller protein [Chitinophaga polysaccharea]|uniref:6-bladed beta-propeller protein n=1 Tax=Chitinophaga polysaccharea TaxID=1293035 RepID=A0A561P750_9BACT|nr:6-bladed beta-propeller [Chitinophaga polysaccharea]TWF33937.1 6-bladed beta-propeller protein [Chitinophaga polysaccharea]